jgi:hypothetical protein
VRLFAGFRRVECSVSKWRTDTCEIQPPATYRVACPRFRRDWWGGCERDRLERRPHETDRWRRRGVSSLFTSSGFPGLMASGTAGRLDSSGHSPVRAWSLISSVSSETVVRFPTTVRSSVRKAATRAPLRDRGVNASMPPVPRQRVKKARRAAAISIASADAASNADTMTIPVQACVA